MITLVFLVVCLTVFASMMYWISTSAKLTARNNQFNMSEAAAEAAVEKVLSQMNYDYTIQSLSNSGTYYGTTFIPGLTNDQASWPVKYAYSGGTNSNQISVNLGPWTTNTVPLSSQYVGLYGLVQSCTITATATPISTNVPIPVSATVSETIEFASIPLFQDAVFYNMDLEIDPGAGMTIKGAVWSNGGIWSGTPNVSYLSTVAAVGSVYYDPNAKNDPFCSGKADSTSGTPIGNFAYAPTSGNDRITMPIGTNNDPATVEALINLPPTNYTMNTLAAFSTNGQFYLANAADLYLTNTPYGTNWGALLRPNCTNTLYFPSNANMALFYQDANNNGNNTTTYQTQMPYDFYILKIGGFTNNSSGQLGLITNYSNLFFGFTNYVSTNLAATIDCVTNVQYAGYSFLTNVIFYDWREGWNSGNGPPKAVQAVQIDIQKYNCWLAGTNWYGGTNVNSGTYYNAQCLLSSHKSHPIDSIYIYNAVPLNGSNLPAVRVVNGGILPTKTAPKGFTVATAMPMYVYGNYNASNTSGSSLGQNSTTYTWPAGLMADAITILSTNWLDANSSFANKATCTSGGPTPKTTTVNAAMLEGIVRSTNGIYSGGLENFLRLLENWNNNVPLYYNGSIIVMFPSQYATNYQQVTGKYYNPPIRNWAFDTNFNQQVGLPPLTPQAKGVIRTNWYAF
jgi:hypothetical protein